MGERTHLTQKTPVFDADGRPVAVIGLSTDITGHKLAQEALRRREAQLAEAQQIAGVGSWHWDPDAHEITWSAELMRMLGIAPGAETVGDDTMELVHPDDRERVAAASVAAMESGGTMELELRMLHADGDYRLLLCRGGATMGPDGTVRRFDGAAKTSPNGAAPSSGWPKPSGWGRSARSIATSRPTRSPGRLRPTRSSASIPSTCRRARACSAWWSSRTASGCGARSTEPCARTAASTAS